MAVTVAVLPSGRGGGNSFRAMLCRGQGVVLSRRRKRIATLAACAVAAFSDGECVRSARLADGCGVARATNASRLLRMFPVAGLRYPYRREDRPPECTLFLSDTCLFFCLNEIKTNMVEILQHARAVAVVFSPFFHMKQIVGTGNYPYLCIPFKKQVGCAVRKVRRPGSSGAGGSAPVR